MVNKCKVEGCNNKGKLHRKGYRYFPRGFCNTHYKKFCKENRQIIEENKIKLDKCSVDNCYNTGPFKKGFCTKHYSRYKKYGDPNKVTKRVEGQTSHYLYSTYWGMVRRCYDENCKDYFRYGYQGVKVDDRWLGIDGFFNFIDDMGDRPEGFSLDRIDPSKGYSKTNCRWADKYTQAINRKDVKNEGVSKYGVNQFRARITVDGVSYSLGVFNDLQEAKEVRKEAERNFIGKEVEL